MIIKQLEIEGKNIAFATSARTPRLYRSIFGRDIISDMAKLQSAYGNAITSEQQLSIVDLEVFENLAYVMAKQANPSLPSMDEWLDDFDTFDIYEILPELMAMWGQNNQTLVESKKK